jgi:hypothetical protein
MCGTFYSLSLKGKEPLERPRHRFRNNIRVCLEDVEHDGVDWIYLNLCKGQEAGCYEIGNNFWGSVKLK